MNILPKLLLASLGMAALTSANAAVEVERRGMEWERVNELPLNVEVSLANDLRLLNSQNTIPDNEPPATQPPATQPPATQPPATQPPATQPPATQPPANEPPVDYFPSTDVPDIPYAESVPELGANSAAIALALLLGLGLLIRERHATSKA